MSDELRDRIAARLELGTSCCELCWESAKEVAQAVIDDLGLRAERANGREETFQRAVGKWER